ncbi:MAG: AraC family transcriptional regulator [Gammaproteobacteria bacterium]|nr:AraC family transcriptional regulator [Gammaproteobacteria bacterium]
MQPERIQVVLDNDIEPIPYGELLLSGSDALWSGFLVEVLRIPESGRLIKFSPYHNLVALCVAGHGSAQIRAGSTVHKFPLKPGTTSIFSAECELESITWSGVHEVLLVDICDSRFTQWKLLNDDLSEFSLSPRFGFTDSQMAALMSNMRAEIEAGCPMGHLYGESLSLALRSYLSGRYANSGRSAKELKSRLSLSQVRRIQNFIDAHLADDLSVANLALLVGLSPHYFSCIFKNTFGVTPHRYVVRQRIRKSRKLLANHRVPILEVAMTLGFASQSHFTDVFRKVTGTTPGRYRQQH